MADEILACKDCIHSQVSLLNRIFTLNGLVGDDSSFYKCTKFPVAAIISSDPVLGVKKEKAKLPFCSLTRREYGECGENGKYWQPKHKKDLFKMLTKEEHD